MTISTYLTVKSHKINFFTFRYSAFGLQCFDAVGWAAGRASGRQKKEWLGAGMVICLELGADLHMAKLIPLLLTDSCFSKIHIGLPFWYRLTHVVRKKGHETGVCVCVFCMKLEKCF